jgi:hypothetical protein
MGPEGPLDGRGRPVGRPEGKDAYWLLLLPVIFLLIGGWAAFVLTFGQTLRADVLSCGTRTCHVRWVQDGQSQYAGVDRERGAGPGTHMQIQVTSAYPGGVVATSTTRILEIYMLVAAAVTTAGSFWLVPVIRSQRARAWAAWDDSHSTTGPAA